MNVKLVEIRRVDAELRTELNRRAIDQPKDGADLVAELVRACAASWGMSEELFFRLVVQRREEGVREKLAGLT
jgi:hypothetical protein